ncbi:DUF4214 domain-containing protein [Devosia sp. RR2S18]|uniref:DUF4214 domain-containing protein n=1 Tax=Devosia rhizosphaerae TaxID=3049774 RepID=UPI0025408305|nr:DUF4214 domain-containing protein [Devosia sp. RR2S18]WIJ24036.1 DUF4214 domain-containing protein [Devosia sp. RR2S18]
MEYTTAQLITQLYIGYYDRAPDPEGLSYWIGRVNAGVSLKDIADSFAASPEAISTYPFLAFPQLASSENFIRSIYQNMFNRDVDADGLAYYMAEISSGRKTPGEVITQIQQNAITSETAQGVADRAVLDNKTEVGLYWTQNAASTPGFEYDAEAAVQADAVVDGVDETQASVDAAKADADAYFAGAANPGSTFTLTTGIDALVGTAGNDTFIGNNATLDAADSINGGTGVDTLSLTLNADVTAAPALTNVERLQVRDVAGVTVNLAGVSGLTSVAQVNSGSNSTTFDNVGSNVAINASNGTGGVVVDYDEGVFGADGSVQINLNSFGTAAARAYVEVISNGADEVRTINIDVAGNSFVEYEDNDNATSLVITGAGRLDLSADAELTDLTSVDASGNTGGLVIDLSGNTADLTLKGSAGADVVGLSLGNLTSADSINLGAGRDTVVLSTGATTLTNANYARINALAGVEQIAFADALGSDIDANRVNIDTLISLNNNSFVNLQDSDTVGFDADGGTVNLTIEHAADAFGQFTGSGVVNLEAFNLDGDSNGAGEVVLDNTSAYAQLVASGAGAVTVNGAAVWTDLDGNDQGVTIDASGLTGVLTISAGTAEADVFIGGSRADIITLGAADTATGNGGADVFVIEDAAQGFSVTITDFVAGTDKLDLSGLTLPAGTTLRYVGEANGFGAAQGSTVAADTFVDVVLDTSSNMLWIDINNDGTLNNNDYQISLTGVTDLSTSDFVFV